MEEGSRTPLHLGQCLFGYDDGHKLLASSTRLDAEDQAFLLQQSDLIPGLDRHAGETYLTGIPLPSTKVYAFMRTWLAPEMPRPGCVWTHALLIDFSDLSRIPDLHSLSSLFVRPSSGKRKEFGAPLVVRNGTRHSHVAGLRRTTTVSCLNALQAAYGSAMQGIVFGDTDEYEDVFLALWSQQWPGLRRVFSFSTATVRLSAAASRSKFSIRIGSRRDMPQSADKVDSQEALEPWSLQVIEDLYVESGGELRRFLWRYGADISRPREGFTLLTRLYASTRGLTHFPSGGLARLLSVVAEELPKTSDGKLLKEDLLKGDHSTYSLLPASDPMEVLSYFVSESRSAALPDPPAQLYRELVRSWSHRAPEILSIVESAEARAPEIATAVVEEVSPVLTAGDFIRLTDGHSGARRVFVRARPSLLDSEGLESVPESELLGLIAQVGDDEQLASSVLLRLLKCSHQGVADLFAERYPRLTAKCVVRRLASELVSKQPTLPNVWIQSSKSLGSEDLLDAVLESAQTTSELAASVLLLGTESWDSAKQSSVRWATVVKRVSDDVTGYARQSLQVYFLSVALSDTAIGCEPLFEYSFQAVHDDISKARLPQDVFERLARHLPDLHWWSQWDTCLRLRIAVAGAYVAADLDPASLSRLTSNRQLIDEVKRTLGNDSRGRAYLQRIP